VVILVVLVVVFSISVHPSDKSGGRGDDSDHRILILIKGGVVEGDFNQGVLVGGLRDIERCPRE
jgi:hypothetical protein